MTKRDFYNLCVGAEVSSQGATFRVAEIIGPDSNVISASPRLTKEDPKMTVILQKIEVVDETQFQYWKLR